MSTRPANIADCSPEQLLELATDLRAICKTHRWEDLMCQLDALNQSPSRAHLVAALEMINAAIISRQVQLN